VQPKLTAAARPDAIDAERFGEMLRSPLFSIFRARMAAELKRASEACERADGDVEVRRAQGAASAWRVAAGLPEAILDEMKKKARG
jgi:hypothetical protein